MQELLLIDKPAGITSFDVIRRLRAKFVGKAPKMGHAGTLDPFATGLLLVGVGAGTKKLSELIGLSKVYEATVLLGRTTDTLDPDGEVITESSAVHITDEMIAEVIERMVGARAYLVPAYAAVKRGGEALYKKARRGEQVDRPERTMEVISVSLGEITRKDDVVYVQIRFEVGSGTYIRSLAEHIGNELKVPAMLTVLRRISIGDYVIENAKSIENIEFFEGK